MSYTVARRISLVVYSTIGVCVITSGCRAKKSINVNAGRPADAGIVADSTAPAPHGVTGSPNLSLADAKPLPTGALPVEGGQYYLMPIPKQGNTGDNTPLEFTHEYFKMADQKASGYFANKNGTSYTIGKGMMEGESNRAEATVSEPRYNLKWDPVLKGYSGAEQTWDSNKNTWNTTPNFTVFTGGGSQPWKFQPNADEWRRQSGTVIESKPDIYNSSLFTGGGTSGVASLQQQPPLMQFSGSGSIVQQLQKPGFATGNATIYNPQNYASGNQYAYVANDTAFQNLLLYILNPYNKPR